MNLTCRQWHSFEQLLVICLRVWYCTEVMFLWYAHCSGFEQCTHIIPTAITDKDVVRAVLEYKSLLQWPSALLSIMDSRYLVIGDSFVRRLDCYQWRVHHKRLCMNGRRVDMQGYSGASAREVGQIARQIGPLRLGRYSAVVLYIGSNDLLTPGIHRSLLWGKHVTFTCAFSLISAQMRLHNKTFSAMEI